MLSILVNNGFVTVCWHTKACLHTVGFNLNYGCQGQQSVLLIAYSVSHLSTGYIQFLIFRLVSNKNGKTLKQSVNTNVSNQKLFDLYFTIPASTDFKISLISDDVT